jgi:adenylate cyclase
MTPLGRRSSFDRLTTSGFRIDAFRLALAVGLVVTALHFLEGQGAAHGFEVPIVGRLEHAARDWLLAEVRGHRPPSGRVVIVAIDERAIAAEGRWPWSRAKLARLVERLAAGGADAVGFDVIWSDDDPLGRRLAGVAALAREAQAVTTEPEAARRLGLVLAAARGDDAEAAEIDPTERLADAIEAARNVTVGFMFLSAADAGFGAATAATPPRSFPGVDRLRFFQTEPLHVVDGDRLAVDPARRAAGPSYPGAVPPVAPILAVADSGGFFTVPPDADGVIRRYPLVARSGDASFPSLGAALLARVLGEGGRSAPIVPVGAPGSRVLQEVRVGRTVIPTDDLGRVPLRWHGPYRTFPSVSATDVLAGRVPDAALRGKIVVVGTTAPGTWDQRITPFDETAPGVVTHATFVDNALAGELLHRSSVVVLAELVLMLLLALGLAALFARVPGLAALPALLLAMTAWVGVAVAALAGGVVLAVGMPLAQGLGMFVTATTWRFFAEERARRRARETFSRFLAPAIVDEVLEKEGALRLGGERRELTVLFADIRGFTGIAERLDSKVLLGLLNEYLTPMTDVIVQGHEGTLDKYMGDAIMAFWGAPKAQADHAFRACEAALAMIERLDALRARWRARGLPDVDIGVGINTGPMSVGFVGSQDRFYNYTVLGDAVNLAARLEGANRVYGTRILVGPETAAAVSGRLVLRALDLVRVKGKREPVTVFEVLGRAPAPPELAAFLERFGCALSAYRGQRWGEAILRFGEADALRGGDPCARAWLARCEAMRRQPPGPEWDGVFDLETK